MKSMGVRWVREEFTASNLHHGSNAPYHWKAYDRVVNSELRAHIHVLGLLDYNNSFGSSDHSFMPHAEMSRLSRDYVSYAFRVVRHFRRRVTYWEIWNEPDYVTFWSPQPNAADYAGLLRSTSRAIHRANRHAKVVLGGTSGVDLTFIDRVAALTRSFDAISVHPYRPYPEPSLLAQIRDLRRLRKSIWFSEIGWPTGNVCGGCTSEDAQASDLVRFYALAAAAHVDHVFWYDLRDDDLDPTSREANFGLLRRDLSAKPAFVAYSYLSRLLAHAQFVKANSLGTAGIFSLQFRSRFQSVAILWNTGSTPRTVTLPWHHSNAILLGLDGHVLGAANVAGGRAWLKVWPGATPLYLVSEIRVGPLSAPGPLIRITPRPTPAPPPTSVPAPPPPAPVSRAPVHRRVNNGAWALRHQGGTRRCTSVHLKKGRCVAGNRPHKRREGSLKVPLPKATPTPSAPTPTPTTAAKGPTPTP